MPVIEWPSEVDELVEGELSQLRDAFVRSNLIVASDGSVKNGIGGVEGNGSS
jgi:hypothetical protein